MIKTGDKKQTLLLEHGAPLLLQENNILYIIIIILIYRYIYRSVNKNYDVLLLYTMVKIP